MDTFSHFAQNPSRTARNFWSTSLCSPMAEHPAGDGPGDRCKHFLPRRAKFVKVRAEVFRKEPARLVTPRRKRHFARLLGYFHSSFQELHNFIFISLYSLRIDKTRKSMYNKARNQRSTAEAQERANPADLKQKGARPMVDMEPAQQGQAVGIR